jgi:hypothetical protein
MKKTFAFSFALLALLSSSFAQKTKQPAKSKQQTPAQTQGAAVPREFTKADSLNNDKPFESDLNLIAQFKGDSVVLRWSTQTPGAWKEANKAGYILSRAELNADGSFDPATFRDLTPEPLKPWPLERWETIAGANSKDDMAKIAAQALYGKSFVTSTGFIHQADEFSTRFSFAMLASDISIKTANASGVRFVDRTIQKGKMYVYRITSPTDTKVYTINPAVITMNTNEVLPTPQAIIDNVTERQSMIELRWKRDIHERFFSAYHIERSDDNGKTYKRLNRLPFIHAVSEKNPVSAEFMVYMDSIPANYKTFWYRIIGVTPFAEVTPPSAPMKAMGKDRTPPPPPLNVKAKHIGGSQVSVTWEYPKQTKGIKGFLIGRGNNPAKEFMPLVNDPLPPKTREYIDKNANPLASNYYIVAVVDTAGNASLSLSQYAMIIDSLPPAPPAKLKGTIDSLGHVTVHWNPGKEKDIRGYNVFFANKADHEFALLTSSPLQDTIFRDTITLKTLTKKIYYRVVAVDYNSNYSKFSEILELKRPDVVPPSQAVMTDYKVSEKGIELRWIPSSSEDVKNTILYRMDETSKVWKAVATYPAKAKANTYTDTTNLKAGVVYSYSLVVFDEDGLQSKRSVPIKMKYADFAARQAVNTISAQPNSDKNTIFVNWNYPVKGEYRFILYRAVNGSAFESYKSISGNITTFNDKEVKKGSQYEYSVGVIYKDGKKAPFGKVAKTVY